MGVIPALVIFLFTDMKPADVGFTFQNGLTSLYWILGLGVFLFGLNAYAAKKPDSLKMYPQMRINDWTWGTVFLSGFGWVAYLIAYEFIFRGVVFLPIIPFVGLWPAIAINACIYALAHVPKGLKETITCIPLGIVLCYLTYITGTIWIAFFVHLILALSNENFSLYYQPEMKIRRS